MSEIQQDVSDKFSVALARLIFEMQQDDYKCEPPNSIVAKLDQEIVERMVCRDCKGKLHYEPFVRQGKWVNGNYTSYRPFTVCKVCGKVQEF